MIESVKDLELDTIDASAENVYDLLDARLQEKLNISLGTLKQNVVDYLVSHAEEITLELPNIAPYGKYEKLIEDNDDMAEFLKTEAAKPEAWQLSDINDDEKFVNLVKFEFICKAVDEGQVLAGRVFISKSGVVRHAFVLVND
jgi:hypothetical protein